MWEYRCIIYDHLNLQDLWIPNVMNHVCLDEIFSWVTCAVMWDVIMAQSLLVLLSCGMRVKILSIVSEWCCCCSRLIKCQYFLYTFVLVAFFFFPFRCCCCIFTIFWGFERNKNKWKLFQWQKPKVDQMFLMVEAFSLLVHPPCGN